MRIEQVVHAQITIPESAEESAKAFYCNLLGLTEIPKPDSLRGRGGFWLEGHSVQIHVAVEKDVDRNLTKAHLAYQVDDLQAFESVLREKGFVLQSGPPIPGYIRFETRDPFGNRIEFMQRTEGRCSTPSSPNLKGYES